jgi:excisionase family DNA binding protein
MEVQVNDTILLSKREQVNDTILLNKRESARSLSISVRKLDGLIATNEIPAKRIGRRVLIARRNLEQFALDQ